MGLPRIRKDFKCVVRTTPNAILFRDFDGKEYWIPRSVCTLIKEKKDRVIATLAAFKFEEITSIEVEPLTATFASLGGTVLPHHRIDIVPIIESNSYPLLPAQRRIVEQALCSRYMALLCEAGTGKTLMSLTVAYSRVKGGIIDNVIVFCPASLQRQWGALAAEYFPEIDITICSIHGASYERSLTAMRDVYNSKGNRTQLIVDEVHLCRNQSAKRSRNIEKSFKPDYCMILTGFPIERNAGDLFYQFGIMSREIIGCENYGQFQSKFLLLGGQDGERVVAYQNTAELSTRINPYISRLTKAEVAPDLPKKHIRDVYFDMSENQIKAYKAINGLMGQYKYLPKEKQYQLGTFSQKLSSGYVPTDDEIQSIFGNLGTLGQGADNVSRIGSIAFDDNSNRMDALRSVLSKISGQVVIWCNYNDEENAIYANLPNSAVINGFVSLQQRAMYIDDFNKGKLHYLIISIAINEGFNLQPMCNNAVFFSDNYSRTKSLNAEDRIWRIGQKKDVYIWRLIARGSLDERIKRVKARKDKICDIFTNNENSNFES